LASFIENAVTSSCSYAFLESEVSMRLRREVTSEMWLVAHALPEANPEWAVELLSAYLGRSGRDRPDKGSDCW
jgi:hypothetical protein